MINTYFSIIIPVYNSALYLDKMLNSVLSQTYKQFELILVDDGSTDGSGEICDSFAQKDNRIRTIHQKNSGASSARNRGMDIAIGDYQLIWDSDDYVEPHALQIIQQIIAKDEPDLLRYNYITETDSGCKKNIISHPYGKLLDRKYIIDSVVPYIIGIKTNSNLNEISHCTLCCKRSVIENNHLRYNENHSKEEDHPFIAMVLAHTQTIEFIGETLYHYIKRNGSLISKYSPRFENVCDNFRLYEELYSNYYDFRSKEKIQYNVNVLCECLEYSLLHRKECNAKREIRKILSSKESVSWFKALKTADHYQNRLKKLVMNRRYTEAYVYVYLNLVLLRANNLKRKVSFKLNILKGLMN